MKSFKKFVAESIEQEELDEAVMQGSKEHLKKLQGMLDKVKPGSVDHSQIRGAIESKFGKQHIPAKHRNVKPDMYEEVELDEASIEKLTRDRNTVSGPLADRRKETLRKKIKDARKAEEDKIRKNLGLDEKLKASDDMGDWVKDFQKSDAPQFKGKSQKKRQQMAVAAKLAAERNEEVELDEAETKYVIKHKKTKQVLNTHDDYATAKDEHEGLGADKKDYGVYKQTKKDAALRNRNTYREEVELDEKLATHIVRGDTYVGVPDRVVAQAKDKVKKMNPSTASDHQKAMNKVLSDMGWEMTAGGKYVREEIELEDYDPNAQMVKREVQKANANRKIAAARNKSLNVKRQTSPKPLNKEEVNESNDIKMVRLGQKMLDLAPKEKNDMISNAYSKLGDALTRYGTDFGPKNVKDLEKRTGLNQRIIMDLIKRAQQ